MTTQIQRDAAFNNAASSHNIHLLAFAAGWFVERVEMRVSFCTDSFDTANFRNWKTSRVGWGAWLGPSSAADASWSSDRTDFEWIWWQASPWIPDYETVQPEGSVPATPANSYRAGLFAEMLIVPCYRAIANVEYQLRFHAVTSQLAAFPTFTMSVEAAAHVAFP